MTDEKMSLGNISKMKDGMLMGVHLMLEEELMKRELLEEKSKPTMEGVKTLMEEMLDKMRASVK